MTFHALLVTITVTLESLDGALGLHHSLSVKLCGDVDVVAGSRHEAVKPGAVF